VVVFNDTLDIPDGLPLPIPFPLPIRQIPLTYTRTEYQWLAQGQGIPIAQINVVSAFQFQLPIPIIPNFGGFSEVLWRDVDRRPVAAFSTVGTLTGCAPLTVKFVNESLRGQQYRWSFGDGRTSVDPNPTHTYTKPGDYSVTLTVSNNFGTDSLRKVRLVRTDGALPAFQAERTRAPIDDPRIKFANQTTAPPSVSYLWDFGDGFLSTERTPTHYYRYPGVYTVSLTTRTASGCESQTVRKDYIEIGTTTHRSNPDIFRDLVVYPNPAHDLMTVQYTGDEGETVELRLTDMTGRVVGKEVSHAGTGVFAIPRPPQGAGVYLLTLTQNGRCVTLKAVWH
jgi:PKD repeat protein